MLPDIYLLLGLLKALTVIALIVMRYVLGDDASVSVCVRSRMSEHELVGVYSWERVAEMVSTWLEEAVPWQPYLVHG